MYVCMYVCMYVVVACCLSAKEFRDVLHIPDYWMNSKLLQLTGLLLNIQNILGVYRFYLWQIHVCIYFVSLFILKTPHRPDIGIRE
jgi:hypothetical protein